MKIFKFSIPFFMLLLLIVGACAAYNNIGDGNSPDVIIDPTTGNQYTKLHSSPIIPADDSKKLGDADTCRPSLIETIATEFDTDLSEYQYISFDDLWSGNFDESLSPLQSIVGGLFVKAKTGDKLPLGVFYDNNIAYTLTEYADGSKALIKYEWGQEYITTTIDDPIAPESSLNNFSVVDITKH